MQPTSQSNYKSIIALAIGFTLLNLDRWVIAPLFPVIMQDLGFGYQDLGIVVGITALTWGVASLVLGGLSDKIGRRKILIPALAALSVFSGITGLAGGFGSMILLRGILGIFEGAYVPTAFAAVKDASTPDRLGLNMGMLGAGSAIATAIAPIIATQLLPLVPSWHWVFVLVSIPGLIVTYFLYRYIQDQPQQPSIPVAAFKFKELLRYRNIRVGILAMCGIMAGIFILSAMVPSYLTDHLKLGMKDMGFVASGIGFGGFIGALLIPGSSDKIGRKNALLIALGVSVVAILAFSGANTPLFLFISLFIASACIIGSLVLLDGPIATETVPAPMIGAASGIIIGIGEIFGGGVAPAISGMVAEKFGIEQVFAVALVGVVFAMGCGFFLKETAPGKQK